MGFTEIDRPSRSKRKLAELDWDNDLEAALLTTLTTGKAIELSLSHFHSSPAKGRLWKQGYAVKHRVLADREHVGAWLEPTSNQGVTHV